MTTIRVEGSWICPSCKNKLKGRDEKCTCGYTGDEEIVFVNDGPQVAMSAELEKKEFSHGPKWWCEFCEGFVQGDLKNCPDCGADHTGIFYGDVRAKKTARAVADATRLADSVGSQRYEPEYPENITTRPGTWRIAFAVGGLLALFGFFFWYLVLNTTPARVLLTSVAWERSIEVERNQKVEHEGWFSAMPSDATLIRKYSKHHHYVDVPDGTKWEERTVGYRDTKEVCDEKNNGDGSFNVTFCTEPVKKLVEVPKTRQVSVTDTYAEWTVWEYKYDRTMSVGRADQNPHDPVVPLAQNERLRKGSESESYRAEFGVVGEPTKTTTERFSLAVWKGLDLGNCYPAEINPLGYVVRVDPATSARCS